ncbi:cytidylyltransferase domain-containing protein [Aquibacillus albus]|uniref:N-acylneuraminate cytidylyltransferase n=1 Tax=Aquibacillus albus TaxID=1168171 RepID=A0ABS2N1Y8_9BACI|nr:acylneuraminate cytidylyltransferase family protein [Aquibacillus albus]MBM7572151.1 N-acylneuraminate cytidylyltransferase [Aquibacillus albus]
MVIKGNCVAIIPARGGSKRIPKKNIINFYGKPLIAWTIKAAKESGIFDHIIISTDDQDIAEVSKEYGAEVPFLRDQYADDHSPVSLATIHTLLHAETFLEKEFLNVVQLMPNCPLRSSNDILEAYNYFTENNHSFQISCFKFGWMNPWWAVKLDSNLIPKPLFKEVYAMRSQDLETLYCPTGAIWIANKKNLVKENTFYGKDYIYYPLDWKAAIDIDNQEDLEMAQSVWIMENNINGNN